ncbi:hypothetical protein M885DRAFT_569849 [Pelagophyceae sp. CCMP2097]|nr:hypothetical protein M885DRAFT_569849 [Pelagophyceae sp. CCMP2097]
MQRRFGTHTYAASLVRKNPPIEVFAAALEQAHDEGTITPGLLARGQGVLKHMAEGTLVDALRQRLFD